MLDRKLKIISTKKNKENPDFQQFILLQIKHC